jgi:hypothetical protein
MPYFLLSGSFSDPDLPGREGKQLVAPPFQDQFNNHPFDIMI